MRRQTATLGCTAIAYNGSGDRGAILQFAEREASTVATILGGGMLNNLKSLREDVADMQILHFACHGWFNNEDPLASYLEIADHVHLTAREIMDWQLSAELVILSACPNRHQQNPAQRRANGLGTRLPARWRTQRTCHAMVG